MLEDDLALGGEVLVKCDSRMFAASSDFRVSLRVSMGMRGKSSPSSSSRSKAHNTALVS